MSETVYSADEAREALEGVLEGLSGNINGVVIAIDTDSHLGIAEYGDALTTIKMLIRVIQSQVESTPKDIRINIYEEYKNQLDRMIEEERSSNISPRKRDEDEEPLVISEIKTLAPRMGS
ncbi:MAG: hypothetical protein PHU72_01470 [Dethiosulfovibrio sp.]|nr:hypothetical protein [Dethiosulfovibrio sp.]